MLNKVFLTTKDIIDLTGYSRSKANRLKREVNEYTLSKGYKLVGSDRCFAKHFEELYGKEDEKPRESAGGTFAATTENIR